MRQYWKVFAFAALLSAWQVAFTYELGTHERLSDQAARFSVLGTSGSGVLTSLGLSGSIEDPEQVFPDSTGQARRIIDLAREGSRLEDTLSSARVRHHFFDPIRGRPLTVSGVGVGERSPDWALEDKEEISAQEFSLKDARRYLFEALTGPTKEERSRSFGLTFQTLGHAIHHLQDMAQPQHVRNDVHLDVPNVENLPGENPSLYETYTNVSIRSAAFGQLLEQPYARVVSFATARKFWVTEEQTGPGRGTGEGMAEFTNNNFVSAGANFELQDNKIVSNPRYFLPVPESVSEVVPIEGLLNEAERCRIEAGKRLCLTGNLVFVRTTIHDKYLNATQPNNRASTLSIFDADLRRYNKTYSCTEQGCTADRIFTLNRFNFDAAHKFLIPRAVAYSAGLIDYFFRGRLEAHDVSFAQSSGRVEVSLKVRNAINVEKVPAWAGESLENRQGDPSQFVLTVKYKQGEEEKLIASNPVGFRDPDPIKPGETSKEVYTFTLPVLLEDATDIEYRIVFRGRLGQEDDAIAVGIVEQVSGFVVQPNYLPDDLRGGQRLITKAAGTWRLSQEQGLQAANIDWKGGYVNGRPTKVLTWWGPTARYFPNPPSLPSPFQHQIYQNGERVAVAPRPVLGAAISRDSEGKEWLIAICTDGAADIVYKRPNELSASPALYDPVMQPDGWREIGRFSSQSQGFTSLNVPWFFNGKGTEAQTMRSKSGWRRLKLTLNGDFALFSDEGNLEGISGGRLETRVCKQETYGNESGCKGNCEGVAVKGVLSNLDNYDSEATSTGQIIVAVDYVEDKPLFATYSQQARIVERIHKDGRQDFRFVCSRDRFGNTSVCSDPSNYAFSENTRVVEREFDLVTKIDIPGAPALVLTRQGGTRSLNELSRIETLGGKLVDSRNDRIGFSDFQETQGHIVYLDLRYGFYVLYERTASEHGTGDIFQSQATPSIFFVETDTTVQTGQRVEFSANTIPANNNPPFVQSGLAGRRFIVDWGAPLSVACGETKENIFEPNLSPLLRMLKTSGAWAVDSGQNLFASMPVLGDDPAIETGGTFNFITGGNLKAIIPPGPDGARYYPGAVVR